MKVSWLASPSQEPGSWTQSICLCSWPCCYHPLRRDACFPGGRVKYPLPMQEMQETQIQRSLGWEDPLGKEMATRCSILTWRIPWTEESGGLQSMRSGVGHDRAAHTRRDAAGQ